MSALSDMKTARATAGTAYAAALVALRTAYVTLGAYDAALANRNVGIGEQLPSFVEDGVNSIPLGLLHAEFAADDLGGIRNDVETQTATNLATLGA
jgi:hypothetical protein